MSPYQEYIITIENKENNICQEHHSPPVLSELSNCIDWILFLLYMVTDRNIAFLVPLSYVLLVELWETSKSVHFLLTEIVKSGNTLLIV